MPQARKASSKKDSDSGASTATKRRAKSKKVEQEVVEEAEDEDVEESEQASNRRKITPEIAARAAEMREEGATWTEVIEETGFNGAQLRPHIARLTEAKIDTLEDTNESVAEHREDGYAWYAMAISLGKSIAEVKEMAAEGGADVEGRKWRKGANGNGEAEGDVEDGDEDEDEEDEDDEEDEEPAPAPKRRVKASSKPASKPAKTSGTAGKTTAAKSRRRPSKAA